MSSEHTAYKIQVVTDSIEETVWSFEKEITGGWRKIKWCQALQFVLFTEYYYDVKLKQYAGHVARMGEMRNSEKIIKLAQVRGWSQDFIS
jgi:hypothetical protein